MRVVDLSNYDYDADIQNPEGWLPAFQSAGIQGVIVGSQWPEKARWQLAQCQSFGMPILAAYAEPDVEGAIGLAKAAGARFVCLAYEPGSIQDPEELYAGIGAVRDAELQPVLYGNYYDVFWAAADARFHDLPLWFAAYYADGRVLDRVDFWPVLWGHQFTSTMAIAGRNRDVSEIYAEVFDMEALDRLARLEAIVIGNGFDAICRPGTEELFPSGTVVTAEGQDLPRDQWIRLTGEAAIEYARRRGFSLALAIEQVQGG